MSCVISVLCRKNLRIIRSRILTKIPLDSVSSLKRALRVLHEEYKVPNVVMSSIPLTGVLLSSLPTWIQDMMTPDKSIEQSGFLLCVSSSVTSDSDISTVHVMVIPRIRGYFVGVGDFFSAMVLGHFQEEHSTDRTQTLARATTRACQITYALLCYTHNHALTLPLDNSDDEMDAQDIERVVRRMKGRELRIIQGRHLITDKGQTEYLLGGMKEWTTFWKE